MEKRDNPIVIVLERTSAEALFQHLSTRLNAFPEARDAFETLAQALAKPVPPAT